MTNIKYEDYAVFYGGNSQQNIDNDHIIHLDCDDTYEGLPNKIFSICKFIVKNDSRFRKFSHFCKVDATTPLENLIPVLSHVDYYGKIINAPNEIANRAWHFNKCSKNSFWNNKKYEGLFIPYCKGGCYILSKKSVECISIHPDDSTKDIYEDLYVAQQLEKCSIVPFDHCTQKYLLNKKW